MPREADAVGVVRRVQLVPGLTVVALTVLLLWLAGTAAGLLLLLFLAVLIAVYLAALTDGLQARTRLGRHPAFALAIVITLTALTGLVALLVPPVVEQTRALVARLPDYVIAWEQWLQRLVLQFPALEAVVGPQRQREFIEGAVRTTEGFIGALVPRVFDLVHTFINVVSVAAMALYLSIHPEIYREFFVSITPVRHREAARDVLAAIGKTLRAWVLAQLFAMTVLGAMTAVGLYLLDVPHWLAFGIFAGAAAIVPFFGSLVSTVLPAFFVLGGEGGPLRALIVLLLGVVVHVIEANLVAPLIFHREVRLPPVFSIMAVLIVGKLLGPVGLLVAVPTLAVVLVFVQKVLIERVYGDVAAPVARPANPEPVAGASESN